MPVLLALLRGHVLQVLQVVSRFIVLQEAVAGVVLTTVAPVLISPGARVPIHLQGVVAAVTVLVLTVEAEVAEVVEVVAEAVAVAVDDVEMSVCQRK